jgi:class 3 adenylate cyclase
MNPLEQRKRPQITLELLVKKRNQQWSSYGCYSPQEKQLAMDEAQRLDKDPSRLSVKLVKETYDPDDNSSSEVTLFASSELTTNRWASGFEHKKRDQSDGKDGDAAKHATNTRKTNSKKTKSPPGGPGLFRALFAILRGLFAFGAPSPPAKSGKSTSKDTEKEAVVEKVKTVKMDEKVEPRIRNTLGTIMKFIASAVAVLDQNTLNMFNKFGICLYIGGASNFLCRKDRLSTEDATTVLSTALFAVGLSQGRAVQFSAEYEAYLLENAKNMQMFQAGREAMIAYLGSGVTSEHSLVAALKAWSEQKLLPANDKRRPLTLMFTDIVGSSALAEERGNEFAMKVVRVHNMIVKSTISHYGGQYIKHTGDGILAAYDDAQMAVKSAAVIQRCVREHNTEFPDLPLSLRVGLNGGETISEGDDVFGSSVNLASRVCALAGAGEVFCTGIIRNRAKAVKIRFSDRGEHAVKGYKDPIPVYEVLWDEGQATGDPGEGGGQKSRVDTAAADAAE